MEKKRVTFDKSVENFERLHRLKKNRNPGFSTEEMKTKQSKEGTSSKKNKITAEKELDGEKLKILKEINKSNELIKEINNKVDDIVAKKQDLTLKIKSFNENEYLQKLNKLEKEKLELLSSKIKIEEEIAKLKELSNEEMPNNIIMNKGVCKLKPAIKESGSFSRKYDNKSTLVNPPSIAYNKQELKELEKDLEFLKKIKSPKEEEFLKKIQKEEENEAITDIDPNNPDFDLLNGKEEEFGEYGNEILNRERNNNIFKKKREKYFKEKAEEDPFASVREENKGVIYKGERKIKNLNSDKTEIQKP